MKKCGKMKNSSRSKLFLILIILCTLLGYVVANGKGADGIYIVDPEGHYALIADSNFDALLLVDLFLGGVITQRLFADQLDVSLTAVHTCPDCNFIYLTSNHAAKVWRMDLPMPNSPDSSKTKQVA
jgi:hypothetical protein